MNEEMMKAMAGKQMLEMAIVESNTLAAMGLRQLRVGDAHDENLDLRFVPSVRGKQSRPLCS